MEIGGWFCYIGIFLSVYEWHGSAATVAFFFELVYLLLRRL